MTRRVLLAAACALAASSARASEKKAEPSAERTVDVSAIGAPIVWKGRLVNYVFLSAKLKLGPGQDLEKLRAKEPYFRDALVRAAHRTPFVDPSDLTRVDERALTAALMREAARIAGPKAFASATVVSQAPRQRSGMPLTGAEPRRGRPITP